MTDETVDTITIKKNSPKKKESFSDTVKSLSIAIILALLFRSIAFEPFYIPSGSMKSTLLVGDYVFVSKYSYGYSRFSFPLGLAPIEGRIMDEKPERGDVIVFKLPSNTGINYIKRLIGLPGDTIQMQNGVLYINDQPIPKKRIGNFTDNDGNGNFSQIPEFIETLPNGVSYHVLDEKPNGALDNTPVYTVPEGHYFFMGDNRDNSQDSRVISSVGFVPEENLLGPANIIFFSSRSSLLKIWTWFSSFRFDRFFKSVQMDKIDE